MGVLRDKLLCAGALLAVLSPAHSWAFVDNSFARGETLERFTIALSGGSGAITGPDLMDVGFFSSGSQTGMATFLNTNAFGVSGDGVGGACAFSRTCEFVLSLTSAAGAENGSAEAAGSVDEVVFNIDIETDTLLTIRALTFDAMTREELGSSGFVEAVATAQNGEFGVFNGPDRIAFTQFNTGLNPSLITLQPAQYRLVFAGSQVSARATKLDPTQIPEPASLALLGLGLAGLGFVRRSTNA